MILSEIFGPKPGTPLHAVVTNLQKIVASFKTAQNFEIIFRDQETYTNYVIFWFNVELTQKNALAKLIDGGNAEITDKLNKRVEKLKARADDDARDAIDKMVDGVDLFGFISVEDGDGRRIDPQNLTRDDYPVPGRFAIAARY